MKLLDHIEKNYSGNQAAFAKSQGVKPQQVTKWLNMRCVVLDGELYSPRRKLAKDDAADISTLSLTVRSENCLRGEGIDTIDQLVGYSEISLSKIKCLGLKSIREIVIALDREGLNLSKEDL